MAYEQPRVPILRDGANLFEYLKDLIRFLKSFTVATWDADRRKDAEIKELREMVNGGTGSGGDCNCEIKTVCGVAPNDNGDIPLEAKHVGALAVNATAADSNKLGGMAASDYATAKAVNKLMAQQRFEQGESNTVHFTCENDSLTVISWIDYDTNRGGVIIAVIAYNVHILANHVHNGGEATLTGNSNDGLTLTTNATGMMRVKVNNTTNYWR